MDQSSQILRRSFSLRQAFTITNVIILGVGTAFSAIILGDVIQTKRTDLDLQLAKDLAVAGNRVDATFADARSVVHTMAFGAPHVLSRSAAHFKTWIREIGEEFLPRISAAYDVYFAFTPKPAQRLFGKPAMAYAITRNLEHYGTPSFDAHRHFESPPIPILPTSPTRKKSGTREL